MARLTVEQSALVDRRFTTLGRLTGENRWAALGRMLLIWNECQERQVHHLTRDEIADIHPDREDFAEALVLADLAERCGDGRLRIKGLQGRIEWLGTARANGSFGKLGAAHGSKGGRPRKPPVGGSEEAGNAEGKEEKETPGRGLSENPRSGVFKTPVGGFTKNPPPAPAPALKNKLPVSRVSQEGPEAPPQEPGTGGGPPGRAAYPLESFPDRKAPPEAGELTEAEIDLEIAAIKGLLLTRLIPVPANGAIAKRVREGARLEDARAAVERFEELGWGTAQSKRRIRDAPAFWVQVFEDQWRQRAKQQNGGD